MRNAIVLTLFAAGIFASGCGGNETANVNINAANANSAATVPPSTNPLGAQTPAPKETVNNAPTLTPVVHAFYDALKRKDDAALKRVLADDFIKSIQDDMKEEKRTDMAAYLAEIDTVPAKPVEVRNERIQGNEAVAEIKGGAYLDWTPFEFVNENGAWKFTGGSSALK